jgi:hypothetical protein
MKEESKGVKDIEKAHMEGLLATKFGSGLEA